MMPFVMGMLTGGAFGLVLYKVGAVRYSLPALAHRLFC